MVILSWENQIRVGGLFLSAIFVQLKLGFCYTFLVRDFQENKKIEEAIIFLVDKIQKSGNNSKPVILHSIEVGTYLYKHNYPLDIVVAGYLHDLLEDSDTTQEEIKKKFGSGVATIVKANSFSSKTIGKIEQYKETFQKCLKMGNEALIVKASDILCNAPFYKIGNWLTFGIDKMTYFLKISKPHIDNERVYKDLAKALWLLKK